MSVIWRWQVPGITRRWNGLIPHLSRWVLRGAFPVLMGARRRPQASPRKQKGARLSRSGWCFISESRNPIYPRGRLNSSATFQIYFHHSVRVFRRLWQIVAMIRRGPERPGHIRRAATEIDLSCFEEFQILNLSKGMKWNDRRTLLKKKMVLDYKLSLGIVEQSVLVRYCPLLSVDLENYTSTYICIR